MAIGPTEPNRTPRSRGASTPSRLAAGHVCRTAVARPEVLPRRSSGAVGFASGLDEVLRRPGPFGSDGNAVGTYRRELHGLGVSWCGERDVAGAVEAVRSGRSGRGSVVTSRVVPSMVRRTFVADGWRAMAAIQGELLSSPAPIRLKPYSIRLASRRPAFRTLIDAGFRIVDQKTFLSIARTVLDPERYVTSGDQL